MSEASMSEPPMSEPVGEQRFEVDTPLGPIWLWGRDTGRPLVLLINGAFAEAWVFDRLQGELPDVDVLRAHLPGNHCPGLVANNIGTLAQALSLALEQRFSGRRAVVIGLSTGALAAMGRRWPGSVRLLLVAPVLRTRHVWLFPRMLDRVTSDVDRELVWNVFGVREGGREERDYSHLVRGLTVPGRVLLGEIPLLPERDLPTMPSLVDDFDRATLARQPLLAVHVAKGAGHHVPRDDLGLFVSAVLEACRAL